MVGTPCWTHGRDDEGGQVETRKSGRSVRLVVVASVVALVLTACGSGSSASATSFKVATVARSTAGAGTARLAGRVNSTAPGEKPTPDTTFTGAVDFANDASTWDGHGRDSDGRPYDSHSITIGGYEYNSTSDAAIDPSSDPTKPWTRYEDIAGGASPTVANVADVSGLLAQLEHYAGRGEHLDGESVRGTPTTHYRFTFRPRSMPAQLVAMQESDAPHVSTIDVWADAQQRLRRYVRSSEGSSDLFSIEYFDFGAPVAIAAPPADQVTIEDLFPVSGNWQTVARGPRRRCR
jgi:hypothetical protein